RALRGAPFPAPSAAPPRTHPWRHPPPPIVYHGRTCRTHSPHHNGGAVRELNWTAAVRRPIDPEPSAAPPRARLGGSLWEDGLTLALAAAAFLCVAANVQHSDWVAGLPALYPIGLGALLVAYGLSRVRLNQALLIPAGLFAGAVVVYAQVMAILAGGSL